MADQEKVIEVKDLGKKFTLSIKRSLAYGTIDVLRNMTGFPADPGRIRKGEFWALQDVNFALNKNEVLGIIGTNGSGKSTLLRILSGIYPPDKGRVSVQGRIGALIAVGAGFHPHMSGRENIYLNGTILGMTRKEISQKFDQIVQFADIAGFLDAPVSTYSSGMKVRLGFAIAVHVDPEILIIDEVLSVGDLSFRNKSLRHMSELREKAKAIIFVSHNLEQIRRICDRVIILEKGQVIYDGPTHEGCVRYEEMTRDMRLATAKSSSAKLERRASSGEDIDVLDLGILSSTGQQEDQVTVGSPLTMFCDFELKKHVPQGLFFSASIHSELVDNVIWAVSNDNNKFDSGDLAPSKYRLRVKIPQHHLSPGVYKIFFAIRDARTNETYERFFLEQTFKVSSDGKKLERGLIDVDEKWEIEKI